MQNKKQNIKAKIIFYGIFTFLILASGSINNSQAAENPADQVSLKNDLGGNIETSINRLTGKVNYLAKKGAGEPLSLAKDKNKKNQAISQEFLQKFGHYFGIKDSNRELKLLKETKDNLGMNHLKYNQRWQGVPVYGGQIIVHLNSKQAITSINGNIYPIENLETKPTITPKEASDLAKKYWGEDPGELKRLGEPKLYIYNKKFIRNDADNKNYLVWELNLSTPKPSKHELFYIDAHNGNLVSHHSVIKKAVDRRIYNCKAWDHYNDCVLVDTDFGVDHGRAEGVAVRGITDVDNLYDISGSAHNYFVATFSRNGANDNGGLGDGVWSPYTKTDGYVRIDYCPYVSGYCPNNAFFDGFSINFCDNMVFNDVVGHEYAHGVSYFSILDAYGYYNGLNYEYESGAIEEANADIFGEALENYIDGSSDWLMGEDVSGGAFRNMADPGSIDDSGIGLYPNKFHSSDFYCGSSDNGGVHHNSTVMSHAAYLMTVGGTYNGCTIGAIGRTKEEAIFYKAIQDYLTYNSGFNEAYAALNSACTDLYGAGSDNCKNVKKALRSVELDQPGGCSGYPATTPECDFSRAPTISSVSSDRASGSYSVGAVIDIDVYFSELVTSTGDVTITFNTGGSCTFTVSGLGIGTCDYTIREEDVPYNYLDVTSISGLINDQDSNAMANFLPGTNLYQNRQIYFDNVPPTVSGVENGQTYRTDVIPTFSEGTATLNGETFSSGQTVSSEGDYTLIVTGEAGNSTTVTFKIEKITASPTALTYKKKKAVSRMRLTFYDLNLPGKLKRKNFRVRFNGRRANVSSVRNSGNILTISMNFKYTRWPRGQYNLVMSYNYLNGRTRVSGSKSKNNLFTIN